MSLFRPEFFDIFGVATFIFIALSAIWALKNKKPLPRWTLIVLLLIGIVGFLVDSTIVYLTYLR